MSNSNVLNSFEQPSNNNDNVGQFNGTINLAGETNFSGAVYGSTNVQSLLVTVTLANINSGKTLLPGVTGKTITILDYKAKVNGNFTTTTAVVLKDTAGSPVVIATNAVAALTDGNILNEKTANVTMGAGYLGVLTGGEGIAVANSGTAAAGGTSITFRILYTIA